MPEARTSVTPKPLFVEGFLGNPYPIYRRFLNEGPIHYIDYLRGHPKPANEGHLKTGQR
jgi:hypothetical protein